MRILFHHRIASADGQFVHLTELVGALRRAGHEVRVVGPAISESSALGETSGFVKALKRRVPKALYEVMECGYSVVAAFRLWREARRFRPDVIYERYNLHLHAGRFVARFLGVPLLLEVNAPLTVERGAYDGLALPGFAAWSDRRIWRGADFVLPVTDVLADHVRAAGVPERRIRVIPNGVDLAVWDRLPPRTAAREALGIGPHEIVFGFVGFIRDWHGLPSVIEFAARRKDLPIRILLVGDGPDRHKLEDRALELGVRDRLQVVGFVPRDAVPGHIAAFDIALQPAVTAWASPLKLFEYLAAGCAVIAPDMPNIREVLAHRRDALLFDPGRPGDMVAALEALCDDPALRSRLGEAARALVRDTPYTWDHDAEVVVALARGIDTDRVRHAATRRDAPPTAARSARNAA